ncbi:MAG: DUF3703 domain-containing protein [Gammaproteobacteria bacterium]
MPSANFFNGWYQKGQEMLMSGQLDKAEELIERAHFSGMFKISEHCLAHWAKYKLALCQKKHVHAFGHLLLMAISPISPLVYLAQRLGIFLPMHPKLKLAYELEMKTAHHALVNRDIQTAKLHFGRSHILGSHFCFSHFRCHYGLAKLEFQQRNWRGFVIQSVRTFGALGTRFAIGFFGVTGHPGSSEIPIGQRFPVPDDLKQFLRLQGIL